jgi:hypothetical protein
LRKNSPPPGFDPFTVLPVVSCYTDCAIPAHNMGYGLEELGVIPVEGRDLEIYLFTTTA